MAWIAHNSNVSTSLAGVSATAARHGNYNGRNRALCSVARRQLSDPSMHERSLQRSFAIDSASLNGCDGSARKSLLWFLYDLGHKMATYCSPSFRCQITVSLPTGGASFSVQEGLAGVVLLGDALHCFPPDLGQVRKTVRLCSLG